jgi:hypothetical protein
MAATTDAIAAQTAAIEALLHEYTRRYVARDVDGVAELCRAPFLAIREGRAIDMADPTAVHDHFTTVIEGYRTAGFAGFRPVSIDVRPLGPRAAFVTVRWHAYDADGGVARDSQTTYHVLQTEAGWRFVSYTNHF